jgi:hypothetical protein
MARQPNATTALIRPITDDTKLERLLHPGRFYEMPEDVLTDPVLTRSERRAILSSWLSDASAVASSPALRQLPMADHPVSFDEIMDALVQLDAPGADARARGSRRAANGPRGPGSERRGSRLGGAGRAAAARR